MNKILTSFIIFTFGILLFVLFTPTMFEYKKEYIVKEINEFTTMLSTNGTQINIEIADTYKERALGLSGRKSLPKNSGLLFIFDEPNTYSFWMKDMNFPIDIIWIDENWIIIDITENISPETFPKNFKPSIPAQYVLEVNANFSKENNIFIGDKVSIP